MQRIDSKLLGFVALLTCALLPNVTAVEITSDPLISTWVTNSAGQYVRLYTNSAAKSAGVSVTTWNYSSVDGTSVTGSQPLPVYSGVQAIYSSSNWVYIRSSGMPASTLGPLVAYAPAALLLPTNQHSLFRFPRTTSVPTTKITTPGGSIGFMVDGSIMFDIRDALSWTGSSEGMGVGYWTRDAYVNEGYGFDPVGGHAAPGGGYHYHSNPIALRYRLGDHVVFNSATKLYSESTGPVTKHSPLLGWVGDGFPVYGPYGYSSATDTNSGLRRMISGFVLRDGQNGTANLQTTGRTNIPSWAQRIYGVSSATGPSNFTSYPLGRYLEDHEFLADIIKPGTGSNYVKGVDFDLDEYNGRFCVTPEFPNGTYAYFVTIDTSGTPVFPYYIGRAFYGTRSGTTVTNITETVMTNFIGGPNLLASIAKPTLNNGTVTLTWSGVEGATYKVETTTDLANWTAVTTNASAPRAIGAYTNASPEQAKFYRVSSTSIATNDSVFTTTTAGGGGGGGGSTITMSPASGTRGTTINVTATISATATPTPPPAGALVQTFTIGSLTVSNVSYATQYQVTGSLTIPANTTIGSQTVTITFAPPPSQQSGPSYTQADGFTVQ